MPVYEVYNVSKTLIHENLDTKDAKGRLEVLTVPPMSRVNLTEAQFRSSNVQAFIRRKRLRFRTVG